MMKLVEIFTKMKQMSGEKSIKCFLDPVPCLQHDDRVAPDHHHSDLVLLPLLGELGGVVQHQVHERVEATESTFNLPSTIDAEMNSLVHEFLELWRVGLGHLELIVSTISLVEVNQANISLV